MSSVRSSSGRGRKDSNQGVYWGQGPSLVAQMVKNLPAVQKTRIRSLGQEDPLEEGMAPHSSILA